VSFIPLEPAALTAGTLKQRFLILIAIVTACAVTSGSSAIAQDSASQLTVQLQQPRIGMTYTEDGDEVRWFAVQVRVVNHSKTAIAIPIDAWRLQFGAESLKPVRGRANSPLGDFDEFDFDPLELYSESRNGPAETKPATEKQEEVLLAFTGLPLGGRLPAIKLTLQQPGTELQSIDINTEFNRRLTIKRETLGPQSAIAVVRVEGELDPVNIQLLADSLSDSVAAGQSRLIVCLAGLKQTPDTSVVRWLRQMTSEAGFGADFVGDEALAPVPPGLTDFHVAVSDLLDEATPDSVEFRDVNRFGERNAHATLGHAIDAAVRSLCETLPRATLLGEIRRGHPKTQAAVLKYSAERLLVDDLPLVISLIHNNEGRHSRALQLAAIDVLSDFGEPTAIDTLESLVRSSSKATEDVAAAAAASLATSRFSAAHQRLIALSRVEDAAIHGLVLRAMAEHPRPIWAGQLRTLALTGEQPKQRTAALTGLVAIGHPHLIDTLARCLEDDNVEVSAATLQLISKLSDPEAERLAQNWVLKRLMEAPPTPAMLHFLLRTRSQGCVPLLRKYLDSDSPVRSQIVAVLVTVGDVELIEELAEQIEKWDPANRELILRALYASRNPLFWTISQSALADSQSPLILSVISLLTETGTPKSVELLGEMLGRDDFEQHATTICYALAQIATSDARRQLQTVWRNSKSSEWKAAARGALEIVYQKSPAIQIVQDGLSQFLPAKNLALEHFELAVEVDPELPIARGQRANAILKLDDASEEQLRKAESDCRFMIEWEPDDSQHPTGLALALIRMGRLEEGVEAAERIRNLFAEDSLYLYNAACVAGRAIEQLRETIPDNESAEAASARQERIERYRVQALDDLRDSIKFGLDDFNIEWMKKDPDLKSIRESSDFEKLFDRE